MQPEFMRPVERRHHSEIEDRTGAVVEPWTIPDLVPAPFGGELLHRPIEIVCLFQRTIDIVGPEDGTPSLETAFKFLRPWFGGWHDFFHWLTTDFRSADDPFDFKGIAEQLFIFAVAGGHQKACRHAISIAPVRYRDAA